MFLESYKLISKIFKTIQIFLQQGDVDIFYEDFVGYGLMHRHQSTEIEVVLAAIEEMKVRVYLVLEFQLKTFKS